jgi:phage terminase small subunit
MKRQEKISPQQELFCQKFILMNFNGTRAARAAGYGKTDASSASSSSTLLNIPKVKDRIDELIAQQEENTSKLRNKLIKELTRLAFSDQRELAEWSGQRLRLINSKKISDDAAAAVSEVSQSINGVSIKVHSKERALDLLGRHLGLWDKMGEQGGGNVQMVVNVPDSETAKLLTKVIERGPKRN